MTMTLRPYQQENVDAIFDYFSRATDNPLSVLPTGSGKSLCIAEFVRRACTEHPDTRILIATHRSELIEQDAAAIRNLWPAADVGIYSSGLGMRQATSSVVVAGVQSIVNVDNLPKFDLLLIDEAHLVPFDGQGQYRTLIAKMKETNPKLKIAGWTATAYRLNGGRLTRGKNKIFSSICYEVPVQRLVDEGYLSPLVTPSAVTSTQSYSTRGVAVRGGEYAAGELAASVEAQNDITRAALTEAFTLGVDRKSWIVFCVSVEHARQAAAHLFSLGVSARVVTGDTDKATRRSTLEAFKRGEIRALVNCEILTTGFDAPCTDCIVLLRPTQSTGLYVQICGRGMRLSPSTGKTNCLVLDYASCIATHGPITAVKPKEAKSDLAGVNLKICAKCDAEVATWKRECPECGTMFPLVPREIDHDTKAANLPVMGPPPEPIWQEVLATTFTPWAKKQKDGESPAPRTVRVTYLTGNFGKSDISEWICPEHGGFARQKFERWWHAHGGLKPFPMSVDETCERAPLELKSVNGVLTEKDGQYTRVTQCRYAPPREPGSDDASDTEVNAGDVASYQAQMNSEWVDDDSLPF